MRRVKLQYLQGRAVPLTLIIERVLSIQFKRIRCFAIAEQKQEIAKEITDTMERVANKPKNYTTSSSRRSPTKTGRSGGSFSGRINSTALRAVLASPRADSWTPTRGGRQSGSGLVAASAAVRLIISTLPCLKTALFSLFFLLLHAHELIYFGHRYMTLVTDGRHCSFKLGNACA